MKKNIEEIVDVDTDKLAMIRQFIKNKIGKMDKKKMIATIVQQTGLAPEQVSAYYDKYAVKEYIRSLVQEWMGRVIGIPNINAICEKCGMPMNACNCQLEDDKKKNIKAKLPKGLRFMRESEQTDLTPEQKKKASEVKRLGYTFVLKLSNGDLVFTKPGNMPTAKTVNVRIDSRGSVYEDLKEELSVPEKHQLKIAKLTLKMEPFWAKVMGMTHEEAKEIIKKLTGKKEEMGPPCPECDTPMDDHGEIWECPNCDNRVNKKEGFEEHKTMKLTKEQLEQLIKEEVKSILSKAQVGDSCSVKGKPGKWEIYKIKGNKAYVQQYSGSSGQFNQDIVDLKNCSVDEGCGSVKPVLKKKYRGKQEEVDLSRPGMPDDMWKKKKPITVTKSDVKKMYQGGLISKKEMIQALKVGKLPKDVPGAEGATVKEVSPPGWSGTTKAMEKHKDIDNPYALAWHMKKKGAKPHYKPIKKEED